MRGKHYMEAYADEAFYTDRYLQGRKPAIDAGFGFYARQASQAIDAHTFGRLKGLEEVPEVVRMCCCELAEAEHRREQRQMEAGGKVSERIGSYSVSFGSVQEAASADGQERRAIILKWLADTGLCYQGVG